MKAEEMDKLVEGIMSVDSKKMLMNLNRYMSEKTEYINVPDGTKNWKVTPRGFIERVIVIKLIPFFGLMVGYNQEFDILVFWKP